MDWHSVRIIFLICSIPGMIMALEYCFNPDAGVLHKGLTLILTVLWIGVFIVQFHSLLKG